MSESKPDKAARALKVANRTREALRLRQAGLEYEQIATALGYASKSSAYEAVMGAIRRIPRESAEALRSMELSRLDRMQAAIWNDVLQGRAWAIDRALSIMERRARLLGLDAPKVLRVDIEAFIRQVAMDEGVSPEEAVALAEHILRERP